MENKLTSCNVLERYLHNMSSSNVPDQLMLILLHIMFGNVLNVYKNVVQTSSKGHVYKAADLLELHPDAANFWLNMPNCMCGAYFRNPCGIH